LLWRGGCSNKPGRGKIRFELRASR
jgi:hypothetical protein